MKTSGWWPSLAFGMSVLILVAPALLAETTVVDIQLGESFTGNIGSAGVDVVQARFSAAEGSTVRTVVRVALQATLDPTIVVRDSSGTPLDIGTTQRVRWLPVRNLVHYFTVPATGTYLVEIGGDSGSGEFWARVEGRRPAGVELVTLSGTVTDDLTGEALSGVEVYADSTLVATTDADGNYSVDLAPGSHTITFTADGFETQSQSVDLSAGSPSTLDVALLPLVPVVISASVTGDPVTGGSVEATVDIQMPPGSTLNSIAWTQESGAPAGIVGGNTDTATVTLGDQSAYKDQLIHVLSEPPISEDDLPPNVHPPEGEFPAGLQDRFQVVAVNPFALEEAGVIVLKVEVDTEFGVFTDEVEIHVELPWKWASGLRNVPTGAPVLLHGKEQASYDWVLVPEPGSNATLADSTTQNPYFTPDIPGLYQLEVTDQTAAADAALTLQVYAGTWRGTIVDQNVEGRPVPDTACTFCHNDTLAPDKFTSWMDTGHAEIFTDNLNTSTHYGSSCFPCHSVGYDPGLDNNGFDNAGDFQDFLDSGLINNPGDNWSQVLENFPETARLANIQCENCHGPQDSNAHGFAGPLGEPRVDISADVCAVCHGEPLRHARFQQWQLSAHANYELAIDEGDSGSCSRCHTGNGFLTWLPILLDDDPETDPTDDIIVTWTSDEVHPQTCATCHDPHAEGTTTGAGSNATVRISGDTPPLIAGFQATDVGRGAICMTCHNSRRGLRNDDVWGDYLGTSETSRAPHGSAQTDVLMGQNAYLMEIPSPGGHSTLDDTCIDCHMEATPPPDLLSYNQGGTNHTFFASRDICKECHSPYLTADDVQSSVQHLLDLVQGLIEGSLLDLMGDLIDQGYTIDLDGDAMITDVSQVVDIEFGESRGRHAVTVTLMGGQTIGPVAVTNVDVLDGTLAVVGNLYDFADEGLMKSGWNWNLINNDGSRGVHNPFFAHDALVAARDALTSGSGGAVVASDADPPPWSTDRAPKRTRRTRRDSGP